jgi:SagB-type dehydrogenase family enzyme
MGDALRLLARPADARKTYEAALKIAEELRDLRSQCVDLGHLGSLALEEGLLEEAIARYSSALDIAQALGEAALQAVGHHQLGRAYQAAGRAAEAEGHYNEAVRINEARGDVRGVEQSWKQLALLSMEAGNLEASEGWTRKAVDAMRRIGDGRGLARQLAQLGDLLKGNPAHLPEARRLVEESLAITLSIDPSNALAWKSYGTLATIDENMAAGLEDGPSKAELQARAGDYRQLAQFVPQFLRTLAQMAEGPSYGRAVILGRLGRCFLVGGHPELGVAPLRQAVGLAGQLGRATALTRALHVELGDALFQLGRYDDARKSYETSLEIACDLLDVQGQVVAARRLAVIAGAEGNTAEVEAWHHQAHEFEEKLEHAATSDDGTAVITLFEDLNTEYAFDSDLLVDGTPERRSTRWTAEGVPLMVGVRPMLVPGVRTWMDQQGAVRFSIPPGEPVVERDPGCIIMRRSRRQVAISGRSQLVWRLVEQIDGGTSVDDILHRCSPGQQEEALHLLSALLATGTIDTSGRPVSRFIHSATIKGVLPAGGLGNDEVLKLATDGEYRAYPGSLRVSVAQEVPARLRSFHTLIASRRSQRDYTGESVRRQELDALLHTACGITGSLPWAEREVKLRAYPSSGALYAVEIYPVILRVDGLTPGVYHYRAVESLLELVRRLNFDDLVRAALPVERKMLAGSAALVCLVGSFRRHERKYGEGGYRMLVAEAGHISQNLVLAATGLGLSARPFGGVFDTLMNEDLGLESSDEQFLLSVLVGHTAGSSRIDGGTAGGS